MKESLQEVIKSGESQCVEFKKSLGLSNEALQSLCGMINADEARGIIIFGISPDRRITGIDQGDTDKAQRSLSQKILSKFEPRIAVSMEVAEYSGKRLLVVCSERASSVAYHEYDGRAFIREGTSTRQLSLSEKQSLTKKRNREHHNGPWKCNRCGVVVGTLMIYVSTVQGMNKLYTCDCGGEFWPIP